MENTVPERAPKRLALNMKATPQLRARVEAEAKKHGLSIAQEVERTLLDAYRRDDDLGGQTIAPAVRLISAMMAIAEQKSGSAWTEDYVTWVAVKKAVQAVLDANNPGAPNRSEMRDAADRVKKAATLLGPSPFVDGLMHLNESPKSIFDAGYQEEVQAALQEQTEAESRLEAVSAPAREAFLEGAAIAADIADLFKLKIA